MLNKLACESFKAINTSCRSYYEDSNLQSFPDFVRSGTPEFILKKSGDCRYFSMNDLTSDPMSGPELCEFYLSEVGRNSSDIKLMECSANDIIYDTSLVRSSIVTDFGLSCGKRHIKSIIGSVYMVGNLIGSLVVGMFADKFGRLPTLLLGALGTSVSGIAGSKPCQKQFKKMGLKTWSPLTTKQFHTGMFLVGTI